ncbi:hypothetical protein DdX_11305 [Ditylenchus destructor]|uniref:Uncharacterized protein n=1 Tax=Ditylenchus destructor TaxID=166010 RepID=A0AAD4MZ96_9BILA|nr:hypothetical protein DdX_11305 [Ditylenchus destructor]
MFPAKLFFLALVSFSVLSFCILDALRVVKRYKITLNDYNEYKNDAAWNISKEETVKNSSKPGRHKKDVSAVECDKECNSGFYFQDTYCKTNHKGQLITCNYKTNHVKFLWSFAMPMFLLMVCGWWCWIRGCC